MTKFTEGEVKAMKDWCKLQISRMRPGQMTLINLGLTYAGYASMSSELNGIKLLRYHPRIVIAKSYPSINWGWTKFDKQTMVYLPQFDIIVWCNKADGGIATSWHAINSIHDEAFEPVNE